MIIPGPLIGLTGRRITGRELGAPWGFHDAPVDAYLSEYAQSVAAAGGVAMHIPLGLDAEAVVNCVDALLIAGGADVDPCLYGSNPDATSDRIDPRQDRFEIDLVNAALAAGRPILGICRGAQLINVALGGTLVNDLPAGTGLAHGSYAYPRAHRRHSVDFVEGSLVRRLYGASTQVNSFHHQAVREPGAGVDIVGFAPDGVAEAIEVPGADVIGLQWHPECLAADPIFDWIVAAGSSAKKSRDQRNHKEDAA